MKYLILALLFSVSTAHAEFIDGNALYKSLKSDKQVEQALAVGYMFGVHDTLTGKLFCTGGITYHVMKEVVIRELEAFPNQRGRGADSFVVSALTRYWPCTKTMKGLL